jgi:mannose-1-phosphate guanylyltransferase
MIPLVNKPFLERMLAYLKAHGITEVILASGYLPTAIEDYFGDGRGIGMRITYSVEEQPLGTAGAVKHLERLINGTFLVFNGDIVTDMDLSAMQRLHRERKAKASLFLVRVEDPTRFGVVETTAEGHVTRFTEKPKREEVRANTINGGCYVLEPETLAHVPPGEYHMFEKGLFPKLLEVGAPMYSYAPPCYWNDVGTPASYLGIHRDILEGRARLSDEPTMAPGEVRKGRNARIGAGATVTGPVIAGDDCVIHPEARITGPAVIGRNCSIGRGAVVTNAVLWDGVQVGESALVEETSIAKGAMIGKRAILHGAVIGEGADIGEGARLEPGATVPPGGKA